MYIEGRLEERDGVYLHSWMASKFWRIVPNELKDRGREGLIIHDSRSAVDPGNWSTATTGVRS